MPLDRGIQVQCALRITVLLLVTQRHQAARTTDACLPLGCGLHARRQLPQTMRAALPHLWHIRLHKKASGFKSKFKSNVWAVQPSCFPSFAAAP